MKRRARLFLVAACLVFAAVFGSALTTTDASANGPGWCSTRCSR